VRRRVDPLIGHINYFTVTEYHFELRKRHLKPSISTPNKLQLSHLWCIGSQVYISRIARCSVCKDFPVALFIHTAHGDRSCDTTSIAGELNEYISRVADETDLHLKHSKLFNAWCVSWTIGWEPECVRVQSYLCHISRVLTLNLPLKRIDVSFTASIVTWMSSRLA